MFARVGSWVDICRYGTFESTITLEERGDATLVTMRALFPTRAERELVVERYRADEGGKQTLGRLAALCEAQAWQASSRPAR